MNEEEQIRKYLLDELSEEAREEVRVLLARDDSWFERALDAENDLIDAYSRGELDAASRGKVERFLTDTSQEYRVGFATQLARHTKRRSGWFSYPRLAALAVAACIVLSVALGVLRHRISVMESSNTGLSSPAHAGTTYSFFVGPGAVRSGRTRTVSIPEGSRVIEIQLALPEGPRFKRYAAEIKTAGGERRWLAEGNPTADAFVLLVSRGLLQPGNYAAELYGITEEGGRELVDYYYFEVAASR